MSLLSKEVGTLCHMLIVALTFCTLMFVLAFFALLGELCSILTLSLRATLVTKLRMERIISDGLMQG